MEVYLCYHDDSLKEPLNKVMPDMKWTLYDTKFLQTGTLVQKLAKKVVDYLNGQDKPKVSTMAIKKACQLEDTPKMTFTRAIESLSNDSEIDWYLNGRSLVRGHILYGFS